MPDIDQQLREDLAMRNAAKALVSLDIDNMRGGVQRKSLGSRFADRMKDGTHGIVDDASDFARANPGRVGSGLALGLGFLLAYVFREPLTRMIQRIWDPDKEPLPDEREETAPLPQDKIED